jgi:putative oxidoreductase
MKLLPTLAAGLLGLAFITFGSNFFLNFIPMPADPSPADAPHKLFMAAMFPTGYLAFVKVLEILGGCLSHCRKHETSAFSFSARSS